MIGTAGKTRQIERKILSTAWFACHLLYRLDERFSVAVKEILRDGLKADDLLMFAIVEISKCGCELSMI